MSPTDIKLDIRRAMAGKRLVLGRYTRERVVVKESGKTRILDLLQATLLQQTR